MKNTYILGKCMFHALLSGGFQVTGESTGFLSLPQLRLNAIVDMAVRAIEICKSALVVAIQIPRNYADSTQHLCTFIIMALKP